MSRFFDFKPMSRNGARARLLSKRAGWTFALLLFAHLGAASATPVRLDVAFPHFLTTDSAVNAIAIQPDGKILIAGPFSTFGVKRRAGIARLNADGTLD